MTTKSLDELLVNGPLLPCLCSNVLYGRGHDREVGLRASELDDVSGKLTNHSVVVYGKESSGNYLVADPWKGFLNVQPETLLCAMVQNKLLTVAQMECDNRLFQISKK